MVSVWDIVKKKKANEKITMITCYDYSFAKILNDTPVDILLVGDSVSMVVHGHPTTLNATVEMMEAHVAAVARGARDKLIVADMPFLSFRKGREYAMNAVHKLMAAGAHAVKVEGVWGHEEVVRDIVQAGVPVMGHVGLVPQSIHQLGGYKVQGKDLTQAEDLLEQAKKLQELGCFSLVAECVPVALGRELTESLAIPVIGIGAGLYVDGQVLVLHDLLGLTKEIKPRFVRRFVDGQSLIRDAILKYCETVKTEAYPTMEESYL